MLQQISAGIGAKPLNILFTGATGCGKSSTINALFEREEAKVGTTPNPETKFIENYQLHRLVIWDTPGLGDKPADDEKFASAIKEKLLETDGDGELLIDLVVVILDGASRDLGTSYHLINKVIIPNLGEDKSRILVAINQADVALKGRHWNDEENRPDATLVKFLEEKCQSVHERIKEATGVDVHPIYYSAGYKEEGQPQRPPYNLAKLLSFILKRIPPKKRLQVVANVNQNQENLRDNDDKGVFNAIGEAIGEAWEWVKEKAADVVEVAVTAAINTVAKALGGLLRSLF